MGALGSPARGWDIVRVLGCAGVIVQPASRHSVNCLVSYLLMAFAIKMLTPRLRWSRVALLLVVALLCCIPNLLQRRPPTRCNRVTAPRPQLVLRGTAQILQAIDPRRSPQTPIQGAELKRATHRSLDWNASNWHVARDESRPLCTGTGPAYVIVANESVVASLPDDLKHFDPNHPGVEHWTECGLGLDWTRDRRSAVRRPATSKQ